jgi:indole-3-glycerol phosphate synthase
MVEGSGEEIGTRVLADILADADVRAQRAASSIEELRRVARAKRAPRSLRTALDGPAFSIIAEIKRRSPSAGSLHPDLDPVAQALAYEAGGADAISVLTEPHHFDGSLADLEAVCEAVSIPVLRKDFTRNTAQIWEARAHGADAVLLIAAHLTDTKLDDMLDVSRDIGVDAIVEAHTGEELNRAIHAGARIVGVNNRDLSTFVTDLSVAERLSHLIPEGIVAIAESGVSDTAAAARMRAAGYAALLVGEALVRHHDPTAFVAALKGQR